MRWLAGARWGVRRTFQTEQAIEGLSVFDNVALVHEHSRLGGASRRRDVLDAITFAGLDVDPDARVSTLGAAQRRLVEVARAVVGQPRLVLLDEPAAGLPDEEPGQASELRENPARLRSANLLRGSKTSIPNEAGIPPRPASS